MSSALVLSILFGVLAAATLVGPSVPVVTMGALTCSMVWAAADWIKR